MWRCWVSLFLVVSPRHNSSTLCSCFLRVLPAPQRYPQGVLGQHRGDWVQDDQSSTNHPGTLAAPSRKQWGPRHRWGRDRHLYCIFLEYDPHKIVHTKYTLVMGKYSSQERQKMSNWRQFVAVHPIYPRNVFTQASTWPSVCLQLINRAIRLKKKKKKIYATVRALT